MNKRVYELLIELFEALKDAEKAWETHPESMEQSCDGFEKTYGISIKKQGKRSLLWYLASMITMPEPEEDDTYPTINFLDSE